MIIFIASFYIVINPVAQLVVQGADNTKIMYWIPLMYMCAVL